MESGNTRKILPRTRPSSFGQGDADIAVEPRRRKDEEGGEGGHGALLTNGRDGKYIINLKPLRAPHNEEGRPRKRQNIAEGRPPNSLLPGVQQLLPIPNDPDQIEAQVTTPCRLVRNPQNGLYYNHGAFIFKSPSPPGYDFPLSIANDTRQLSFAIVEPNLMDLFKHAWYLRQYVRSIRVQRRDMWWDHKMMSDCYGIDSALHGWSSNYEPGTAFYQASMLYKNALWLYFNRSVQPSIGTTSFRDVVDDGLHHLQMLERAMGNGDRLFLVVPIFLLGTSAFEQRQRTAVFRSLEQIDPTYQTNTNAHAMHILDLIWNMMDDQRVSDTWDWERLQDPARTHGVLERSLVELLEDPWRPAPVPPRRARSPEALPPDFDNSRFRAAPLPPPGSVPPMPEAALNTRNSSGDTGWQTPSQGVSPTDASRPATMREGSEHWADPRQERTTSQSELAPAPPQPRPFLAPPPPSSGMMTNSELMNSIRSFTRKIPQSVKVSKSSVPPCQVCGKELKNPSDAQKHQLQHSKPFVCRESGCPRTQGFATENDLQRHRKSVHGASPRIGNKTGYICVECPEPSDGTPRKWWPRLDNFKAHIRRKHLGADEETLITRSTAPRRQEDTYTDSGQHHPGSETYTPTQERQHHQNSITSQISDVELGSEHATQDDAQIQHAQLEQGADEDEDEDEEEAEEEEPAEEMGDGPVGPWELHRSFRKRRRNEDEETGDGAGDEDDDESPTSKEEGCDNTTPTLPNHVGKVNGDRVAAGVDGEGRQADTADVVKREAEEDANMDVGDRSQASG